MSSMLAIASRELREKKFVFGAAAIVAILPLFAALMPAARFGRPAIISLLGGILAMGFALALSIVLGSSTIGRDLTDNRLSFYFSKPLSPAALWFGKVVASLLTVFGCLAITLAIPTALAFTKAPELLPNDVGAIAVLISAGAVALFALSHVFSSMIRSRTALVIVDMLLLVGTVYALVLLLRPIVRAMAMTLARNIVFGFGAAFIALLLVAPVWQLSRGRTDRRRSHLELSKFVWAGVVVLLVATGAYIAWALNIGPKDLTSKYARPLPAGDWLAVTGETEHRADLQAFFLANTATGESVRLLNPMAVTASRNGRFIAWTDVAGGFGSTGFPVNVRELGGRGATIETGIVSDRSATTMALTDDGNRMAVFAGDKITIHDLGRRALLSSVRLPVVRGGYNDHLFFVTPELVRAIDVERDAMTVYDIDVPRRTVTMTGRHALADTTYIGWVSEDGSRLMLRDWRGRKPAEILDARTLQTVATPGMIGSDAQMLSDGNLAAIAKDANGKPRLHVVDLQGTVLRDYPLPGDNAFIDAEAAAGKLVVATKGRAEKKWLLQTVDLATGQTLRRVEGLQPVNLINRPEDDPRTNPIDPRPRVCMTDGGLVTWHALTGETKKLF
ncbi:MAG TPA: ABC transporter permease [Thermoanaerobaculia bacterium]|jgi:ABC-type transport system involved in multi-copper enzyme maturation permease subunit